MPLVCNLSFRSTPRAENKLTRVSYWFIGLSRYASWPRTTAPTFHTTAYAHVTNPLYWWHTGHHSPDLSTPRDRYRHSWQPLSAFILFPLRMSRGGSSCHILFITVLGCAANPGGRPNSVVYFDVHIYQHVSQSYLRLTSPVSMRLRVWFHFSWNLPCFQRYLLPRMYVMHSAMLQKHSITTCSPARPLIQGEQVDFFSLISHSFFFNVWKIFREIRVFCSDGIQACRCSYPWAPVASARESRPSYGQPKQNEF